MNIVSDNQSEWFALRRDEVGRRLDPHFHRPKFRCLLNTLTQHHSVSVGQLVARSTELWDKEDGRFADEFPYIEISAVGLQTNEYAITRVPVKDAPSRARQVVRSGDIMVSLTRPHRGAIAVVRENDDGAIASTGFAVLRTIRRKDIDKDFLYYSLVSGFALDQLLMRSSGGSYPAITEDELDRVLIPIPPLSKQRALVSAMDAARTARRAKQAEAHALLSEIDAFILKSLEVSLPPRNYPKIFAVRQEDVKRHTLGVSFYAPELQSFLRAFTTSRYPIRQLQEEVLLNPPIDTNALEADTPVSFVPMDAVAESAEGTVHLQTRLFAEVQQGYTIFAEGDLLWAKITPCMENGKSCIANGLENGVGFGSTEFHVLRPASNRVDTEYLHAFLSLVPLRRAARFAFSGSAGHQRVPESFIAGLPFPVPPIAKQKAISAEVCRRRKEARQLIKKADADWHKAKAKFEAALLG